MPEVFRTQRRVEFRDTDAAGIMHFSVFFVYMEQVEHEFLRHLGQSVVSDIDNQTVSWPRVSATCDYRRPIGFEQMLDVDVWVERIGNKSVTYGFKFYVTADPDSTDEGTIETVAEGSLTAVCCEINHGQPPVGIQIPDSFVKELKPYVRV